jgi:4-amino-4-deoxy-L-arabinose transferase-like glycosyltransferase
MPNPTAKYDSPSKKIVILVLCGICFAYLFGSIALAKKFPPLNSDEVVRAVIGVERIQGHPPRYSLYDDIFAPEYYSLRDVLPDLSISIYHYWLGAWTELQRNSFLASRFSSIVPGVFVLLCFYGIGRRLGGVRTGLWSVILCGMNPFFLMASVIARPEMLLVLTSTALLWFAIESPERFSLKPFLIGSLGFLQIGIHPNAALICLGIFMVRLLAMENKKRWREVAMLSSGAFTGVLIVLLMTDLNRLWLGMHTLHSHLVSPPIVNWPWKPWELLTSLIRINWTGETYYFSSKVLSGWSVGIKLWWIAVVATITPALLYRGEQDQELNWKRWAGACLLIPLSSLVLVRPRESLYVTNMLPLLIPLCAHSLRSTARPYRWFKWLCAGLLCISFLIVVRFFVRYVEKLKSYDQIVAEVRSLLPQDQLKIAGPAVLWYAFEPQNFRDSGGLLISHWYANGRRDLETWLEPWQPAILIFDEPLANTFLKVNGNPVDLGFYFKQLVEFLGVVDTKQAYGQWRVYRLHWEKRANS